MTGMLPPAHADPECPQANRVTISAPPATTMCFQCRWSASTSRSVFLRTITECMCVCRSCTYNLCVEYTTLGTTITMITLYVCYTDVSRAYLNCEG